MHKERSVEFSVYCQNTVYMYYPRAYGHQACLMFKSRIRHMPCVYASATYIDIV